MIKLSKFSRGTLIRIDDIAENMNWQLMNKCEILFNKYNIKPVLGVIPKNKDPKLLNFPKDKNFWTKIKNWQNNGWEISLHGYSHDYDVETHKKDFFKLGGKSEFFGKSLDEQIEKINNGLEIFKSHGIKTRSFFAPNHTYDSNTFEALKKCGIEIVLDGYGLQPYYQNNLIFIPQLFYRILALPFAFQTTQLHLNEWNDKDYINFENFIIENQNKIITFQKILDHVSNNLFSDFINNILKVSLVSIRKFLN